MPIVPGRYGRAGHTGWTTLTDVEVPVTDASAHRRDDRLGLPLLERIGQRIGDV